MPEFSVYRILELYLGAQRAIFRSISETDCAHGRKLGEAITEVRSFVRIYTLPFQPQNGIPPFPSLEAERIREQIKHG